MTERFFFNVQTSIHLRWLVLFLLSLVQQCVDVLCYFLAFVFLSSSGVLMFHKSAILDVVPCHFAQASINLILFHALTKYTPTLEISILCSEKTIFYSAFYNGSQLSLWKK